MKPNKKESSFFAAKRIQRKLAMQSGFYDGRFKQRAIKDKKKESTKKLSRKRINPNKLEE